MRLFLALLIACAIVTGSGTSFSAFADTGGGTSAAPSPSAPPSPTATPEPLLPIMFYTPKPEEKPPDTLTFRQPVLFVVVLGSDASLKARVSVAMARILGDELSLSVVPEGDWAIKDYIQQCKSDPSTVGAFIVQPPSYGSGEQDGLVYLRQLATVQFNAMISTCPQFYELHDVSPRPTPGPPQITWVAQTSTGTYGRTYVQFLPFAVLTSVYLAFAPQKLYQVVTTHNNRVPSPVPSAGYNSTVATEYQNTINPSGTSSLQNSVVTSVGAAALDFGQKGDPNNLTAHAAEAAAWQFLRMFRGYCEPNADKPLARSKIDETFCPWFNPFIGGKITYDEGNMKGIPAHNVPVTLTETESMSKPGSTPTRGSARDVRSTLTDCLGTFHFMNVKPGSTYNVAVSEAFSPEPKAAQQVTVQKTGDGARQIVYFSVATSIPTCPPATPTPSPPQHQESHK